MADHLTIDLTVPVYVNGCVAFEFEAAVEINVTYRGCKAQLYGPPERCYPAEAPEWDVTAYYVDCGSYDVSRKRWQSNLQPAPEYLRQQIDAHMAGRDGVNRVAERIAEEMREYA